MDSLRYWVTEMHVDGFRFDLASTLAREFYDVDRLSTFFDLVQQDPVVSQVKLIAEPWDIGPGGYQVGNFPPQWTEWNGSYRDTVRDFWRGEPHARRVRLPADRLRRPLRARRPRPVATSTSSPPTTASRCATWCPTTRSTTTPTARTTTTAKPQPVVELRRRGPDRRPRRARRPRARAARNFLATLLLSQGVPMILHGDELGRTQDGNNNTYGQDNELTWIDWDNAGRAADRVHRGGRPAAAPAPDVPPQRFFTGDGPRTAKARAPAQRHRLAAPPTAGRWTTTTGTAATRRARHVPQRRRHRRQRQRGSRSPTTTSCSTSTPTARIEFACPRGVRRRVGRRDRHRRDARRHRADDAARTLEALEPQRGRAARAVTSPRPSLDSLGAASVAAMATRRP